MSGLLTVLGVAIVPFAPDSEPEPIIDDVGPTYPATSSFMAHRLVLDSTPVSGEYTPRRHIAHSHLRLLSFWNLTRLDPLRLQPCVLPLVQQGPTRLPLFETCSCQ